MKIRTKPLPPPVYRPQTKSPVLQKKTAPQQTPQPAKSAHGPSAPPAYRPQPAPKVLQPKSAPARPPVYQTKFPPVCQTKSLPVAPPAYRPEVKKVVQQHRATQQMAIPATPPLRAQASGPRKVVAAASKNGVVMRQTDSRQRPGVPRVIVRSSARSAVVQRSSNPPSEPNEPAALKPPPPLKPPAVDPAPVVVVPAAEVKAQAGDDEEDEGAWYSNGKGGDLPEAHYDELQRIIDLYDVALDKDFRRGSSGDKKGVGAIGVGLVALVEFTSKRAVKHFLEYIIHPGAKDPPRDRKYKGRTFMDIVDMCRAGEECHNDLAEALRECLGTLKKE